MHTPSPITDSSLWCRVPGCPNRWTCDMLHGRVCSEHDARFSRQTSTRPPAGYRQERQTASLLETVLPEPAPHWTDEDDNDPFNTPESRP